MNDFIFFWQHMPEHIRPYIFEIGSFQLRYYGLMYIIAFACVYILSAYRLKHEEHPYARSDIENYLMIAMIGLLAGARLGYVLFYNLDYYMHNPLEIIVPFSFEGGFHVTGLAGMSYHGGLAGVILSTIIYCRKNNFRFWQFCDFIVPSIPLGYTFGRIGNFINGELYGRATNVPWGMYFPLDAESRLRHPSQLYEALLEGVFLFIILWHLRKKNFPAGSILALYMIGYGTVRFFIEFFREPDQQLGVFFSLLSMGQILCFLMIMTGAVIFFLRRRSETK